jgi:cell division protein FtsL
MTLAVLVASFCVTIAAVYISAYARVAAEGMEEARLQRDIDAATVRHSELKEEESGLSLASDVEKTAQRLSMVPNDAKSEQLLLQATEASLSGASSADRAGTTSVASVPSSITTTP